MTSSTGFWDFDYYPAQRAQLVPGSWSATTLHRKVVAESMSLHLLFAVYCKGAETRGVMLQGHGGNFNLLNFMGHVAGTK